MRPTFLTAPTVAAFDRAIKPDYFGWLDHVSSAAGCSQPIRLAGRLTTRDHDGQVLTVLDTERMPDGVICKNCGNRRASVCPSCSTTYHRDEYQLIRAGLVGGKGVPATGSARSRSNAARPGLVRPLRLMPPATGGRAADRPRRTGLRRRAS